MLHVIYHNHSYYDLDKSTTKRIGMQEILQKGIADQTPVIPNRYGNSSNDIALNIRLRQTDIIVDAFALLKEVNHPLTKD